MTTKEIIDAHFTTNLSYYRSICVRMCSGQSGRDLLNSAYVKLRSMKDELILKYHNKDKLKNLVIYVIRDLFKKRNCVKKYKNGNTNELYIHSKLPNNIPDVADDEFKISDERLNDIIIRSLSDPESSAPVSIFIQAQSTSILEISRNSKLSRPYVTKMYEKGRQILLKQL